MNPSSCPIPAPSPPATSLVLLTTAGLAVALALISWRMTHPDPRHQHPQRAIEGFTMTPLTT